jgi:peptide/nickel transport system permease protein
MSRFLIRRLLLLPPILLAVHFLGFAYAVIGRWYQLLQNPFFAADRTLPSVWAEYVALWGAMARGDVPNMPGGSIETIGEALRRTGQASLGLIAIAFVLALVVGLGVGIRAVRTQPPGVAGWLVPAATLSLAMPSFYIGAVILTIAIYYFLFIAPKGAQLPFPLRGFGWDEHLILPVVVLMVWPAMQIAQVTAVTLGDELHKQYVTAARSLGHTWFRLRWRTALKNALAPIVLAVSGGFRLLVVELILVEWLFGWPGLGSLLAETLFRPQAASMFSAASVLTPAYLYPPLVAALLACFAVFNRGYTGLGAGAPH